MQHRNLLDLALPYQRRFLENGSRRKIWNASRQCGKSWALAFSLVYGALHGGKQGLSLCISTGQRAASEIIRKCSQFAEAVKMLSRGAITYSAAYDKITFSNGARVISLPSSTDGSSLRGWTVGPNGVLAIDEAAFIRNLDDIIQAIAPTLTRNASATLMLTTTPAGKDSAFYRLYEDALNNPEWYVQQTTIEDAIADGLQVDINSLRQLCPDPDRFAQEYMCKFCASYSSFIDTSLLEFCPAPFKGQHYFGIDVGRTSDRTAIAILASNGLKMHLEDVVLLSKCSYSEQKNVVQKLFQKFQPIAVYGDSGGIGSAFIEDLSKTVSKRIHPFTFTGTNKEPAYEALRASVLDCKITFAPELKAQVIADFENVHRIVSEAGKVSFEAGHSAQGHSDLTSALVLAVKAAHDFRPCTTMPQPFGGMRSRLA